MMSHGHSVCLACSCGADWDMASARGNVIWTKCQNLRCKLQLWYVTDTGGFEYWRPSSGWRIVPQGCLFIAAWESV